MQGSLQQPPIIITTPKVKVAVAFVIAALAALSTIFIRQIPPWIEFPVWLFAILFAGVLMTRPRLTLSEQGLLHSSLLGRKFWAWTDFDQFEVYKMPFLGITSPGCRFSAAYIRSIQPAPDRLRDCSR